jgi:hypothetical protein
MGQKDRLRVITLRLTEGQIRDLIAFGNRAQMSGQEAPVWVELNGRLMQAIKEADQEELDLSEVAELSPGGSA